MPHHHHCKKPKPYLIITNISKRQNVRNLIQIGASFGVTTIFVVGQKSFNFDVTNDDGNNNKSSSSDLPTAMIDGIRRGKMTIIRFDKLEECVQHIKSLPCCEIEEQVADAGNNSIQKSNNSKPTIQIIGVEIDPSSVNLENEPFTNSTAFMMGNEGQGMTKKQMSVCDGFVRISQYGGGTASLNVSVAAGLVLHRFFHWSRGDDVVVGQQT
mmetsp:Transcript_11749/g.17765  ORF Transcript_11749/g.17765 Transcript_11749/m.17765 type:complete len:212 (-) Transcript_11749:240-875(-)